MDRERSAAEREQRLARLEAEAAEAHTAARRYAAPLDMLSLLPLLCLCML